MDNHNHHHYYSLEENRKKLFISIALTSLIFFAELIGGIWTRSLALLSDSAHVFMDVFALVLSYLAIRAASLPPDDRHTFGYHRLQVIAALINGTTLLIISYGILSEAINRFKNPEPVIAGPMLVIAIIGLVVNLVVALVLHEHDHDDLNTRAAFLHVVGDALASVGVIGAGFAIMYTGQQWIDPFVSVLISVLILVSSGRLLKETLHILIEGMPSGIKASDLAAELKSVPGIQDIHDLHIWTVSPSFVAMSAHVTIKDQLYSQSEEIMSQLKKILSSRYGIDHTTIQFECKRCGQGAVPFISQN